MPGDNDDMPTILHSIQIQIYTSDNNVIMMMMMMMEKKEHSFFVKLYNL